MKLIACPACEDVVRLIPRQKRQCRCQRSWGRYYANGVDAVIGGQAVPIGFGNRSLAAALRNRPSHGLGRRFDAFVIPENCDTIEVKDG